MPWISYAFSCPVPRASWLLESYSLWEGHSSCAVKGDATRLIVDIISKYSLSFTCVSRPGTEAETANPCGVYVQGEGHR